MDSRKREKKRIKGKWTEEGVNQYKENISRIRFQKEGVDEMMKELKQKIDKAVSKKKGRSENGKQDGKVGGTRNIQERRKSYFVSYIYCIWDIKNRVLFDLLFSI